MARTWSWTEYISKGLRDISQELAERELGPQSEHDYLLDRSRGIDKNYWTDPRALERRAGGDRVIDYSTTPIIRPPEKYGFSSSRHFPPNASRTARGYEAPEDDRQKQEGAQRLGMRGHC